MTSRAARRRLAWSVPVVTTAAVVGATLVPSAASADRGHPVLPARTANQLLAAVQSSAVDQLSGTIVETARLGIPSLPGSDNAAALTWQTLVMGTHTARVWLDGPHRQRLALLGQLAESDVVHSGRDIWTYASDTQHVGHQTLDQAKTTAPDPAKKDLTTYTPKGAADQALAALDPSTVVTVDPTARVAGHPAYTLVLTPRDSRTTVRKVTIAIDAKHNVPLRVRVYGTAAKPAFEIGFSDVTFKRPAARVFGFTPPKHSTVSSDLWAATSRRPGTAKPETTPAKSAPAAPAGAKRARPTTIGTGWTSVLALAAPADGSSPLAALSGRNAELLGRLTQTLGNGDKLIRSALLNVLITKDGRVFLGAVSPDLLQQAAVAHAAGKTG